MAEHTYMLRQNLADIESYASAMLGDLERGAGEFPQWTNHIISTVRTHMHDVVHFLRHQSREGRKYGYSHRVGPGTREPAQMEFSTDPGKHLGRMYGTARGEPNPWYGRAGVETTSKRFYGQPKRVSGDEITVTGSRIRRYGVPGRPFGTPGWYGQGGVATADSGFLEGSRRYAGPSKHEAASMARKNLREIAEYAREAAGYLEHGAGIAPAWVEHKLSISAGHMDGMGHWLENEGVEGRKYGQPRGRRGGGRARPGPGGGHGPGPGHVPNPMRRGRFWRKHPHRHVPYHPTWGYVPWMYPGNGIDHHTGFQADIHLGEPAPVPYVSKVYAREADGKFILGMRGSGFSAIDESFLVILFRMADSDYQQARVPARILIEDQIEVELPLTRKNAPEFALSDIGFVEGGEIYSLSHSFFQTVPHPYAPFGLRKYGLNVLQKFDGPSGPLRPHSQALGIRRYAMTPGEMVESESPMGYLQRPWRNLRPGYGPVQEYGSMGYGSMGTGSMDQAVQQAMLQRTRGSKVP